MKENLIDLEVIDNEDENPIEEIMSTVERYSLVNQEYEVKDKIEKQILHLERIMQDMAEENSSKQNSLNKSINELLKEYSLSFVKKQSKDTIELLSKSLNSIIQFSQNAKMREADYIIQNSRILSPKLYLQSKGYQRADFEKYCQAATVTLTHFDIANSNWLYFSDIKMSDKNETYFDSWDLELFFDLPIEDSHKPLEFLYQFIEILNSINGVKVKIEDISIGSLRAKLKVLYENARSKEEVKELLESSVKFAKGKLEKDFEESEKLKKEAEKIDIEKKLLIQELESNTSIENAYKKSLEIQSAEEDLRKKKLENALLQIELMEKGSDALAELLAKGFISQKQFELMIKGLSFIKISDNKLLPGESLDVIDNL